MPLKRTISENKAYRYPHSPDETITVQNSLLIISGWLQDEHLGKLAHYDITRQFLCSTRNDSSPRYYTRGDILVRFTIPLK